MPPIRLIASTLIALTFVGCQTLRQKPAGQAAASDRDTATVETIAERTNENSRKIQSISCQKVVIDGKTVDQEGRQQLYTLDAMLAFQKPDKLRIKGFFAARPEVDLGCNPNEVWFWVKRMEPGKVFFLPRSELANARINLPFQPDWIAEALGMVEIEPRDYRFERSERSSYSIVTTARTPAGLVDKRLTFSRARQDRLTSIQLFSLPTGVLTAAAIIDEYWDDPKTGVYCPRKIRLVWQESPTQKTSLTVSLRRNEIELNNIPAENAEMLFSRDGLSDKEWTNIAQIDPATNDLRPASSNVRAEKVARTSTPPSDYRDSTNRADREKAGVLTSGAIELGQPKVMSRGTVPTTN